MSKKYEKIVTSQYFNGDNTDSVFPSSSLTINPDGNLYIHDGSTVGGLRVYPQLGNITLPQGSTIRETSLNLFGTTVTSMTLTPNGGASQSQQVLIYPTVAPDGNHIHITSGDQTQTDIYLGNDNQYVKVAANSNVVIGTNTDSQHWVFDSAGRLTVPQSGSNVTTSMGQGIDSDWLNPNNNVWSVRQYNGGSAVVFDGTNPVLWYDYAATPLGVNQLRGAIIEFHAYVGNYICIGSITISRNYSSDFQITHSMTGGDVRFSFWEIFSGDTYGLAFRDFTGTANPVMIHWTSRVFYGSEWDC